MKPCVPLKKSNEPKNELLTTKFRYLVLIKFSTNFLIGAGIPIFNRLIEMCGMTLSKAPTMSRKTVTVGELLMKLMLVIRVAKLSI